MRTPGRSCCIGALTCFAVFAIAPRAKADGSTAAPQGSPAEVQQTSGLLFPINSVIQAYEPNEIGYTFDVGKESFMDFTVSMMLPLWIGETYPPQFRTEPAGFWRPLRYARRFPYVYFAVTQRAGQYLETRYSSPVVGKRFNPLISFRLWALDPNADPTNKEAERNAVETKDPGHRESQDNFLEFVYAHESNGQYIDTPETFWSQVNTYMVDDKEDLAKAYHAARDNISRGWDYVGLQYARDGDVDFLGYSFVSMRAKFSYYLPDSFPQQKTEQFNFWEETINRTPILDGKQRELTDGVSLRINFIKRRNNAWIQFANRISIIGTTGYFHLLKYDTIQGEMGVRIGPLPLMLWYRHGFNGDQADYFHRSDSYGMKFSYWRF